MHRLIPVNASMVSGNSNFFIYSFMDRFLTVELGFPSGLLSSFFSSFFSSLAAGGGGFFWGAK